MTDRKWNMPHEPIPDGVSRVWLTWVSGITTGTNSAEARRQLSDGNAIAWMMPEGPPAPYEPPKPRHVFVKYNPETGMADLCGPGSSDCVLFREVMGGE